MRAHEVRPSKLVIFDIDDTLVYTSTKVHVVNNGRVIKSLNSHDFTHYKLQPGESFDFEDFRNAKEFFEKSRPIIPMLNQLKADISTGNKVVMVTARADFDDRELFLDTFRKYGIDMGRVHVYRAGNITDRIATEEKKKRIIRELLNKGNYTKAIMYDDAVPNLNSFVSLKKEYPNTRFYAWYVSLDGKAKEYSRTNEQLSENRNNQFIQDHVQWVADQLGIESLPKIAFLDQPETTSFGGYSPEDGTIRIVTGGRHPVDVLRTLAHELTHYRQDINGELEDGAGATGTPQENEANAEAGVIMRDFAANNPKALGLHESLFEEATAGEITNRVVDFYKHEVGPINSEPIDDYLEQAKELLTKSKDSSTRSKLIDIFKRGRENPYIQGGIITTIGALLTGGLLSTASQMHLTPAQTNILLQAVLNTVIPTVVSRINGKNWIDTIKYTLASAGIGTGIAVLSEEPVGDLKKDLKNPHSYDAIDHMMKAIAQKYKITPKELHDRFVEKTGEIPDDWIKKHLDEDITPKDIHKLADKNNIPWDNEPSFLKLTKRLTGKEHLDDLDQNELQKVKHHLEIQCVTESFDQPYPLYWAPHGVKASAKLNDGSELDIMFDIDDKGTWRVLFSRNNDFEVTGEGDAQRVFATVLSAIVQFVKKHKPKSVIFSASKDVNTAIANPESRVKLYDRLVQRYASLLGYKSHSRENGDDIAYTLRPTTVTTEATYPGNIGMMEVSKFFNIATPEEKIKFKQLKDAGETSKAWRLIQQVIGVKLQGNEFAEQMVNQGVAEGVPQPGPSSGAPKKFGPDAKIETGRMTVKQIISSIPGVPYYNNVVDDWDAKDYSWGVTKKVIEYATYLKDHPESLEKLPPAIVLNGKFEDGAHRVSAIWLLQQRMDPKNPLWANTKLKVQFVKQGVTEGRGSGYKEIEFVCANPEFPDATDHALQKQMYTGLQRIPGVIPLFQDQSDYSEGQYSLTAIYKDPAVRGQILKLAKQLGVSVDLEQSVTDDYVDRAIRGEHEGQQGVAEGVEQSLSSMVSQDQAERNEYAQFVKSQAGGDWTKGAKMYAQLKKRSSNNIFGDAARLNQFMTMKFDFDKFTAQDWKNYWLLAQHCDMDRDFQKNALSVIKKYQGEDHINYQYLYDRISCGTTGKQKYGTQDICGKDKPGVAEGSSNNIPTIGINVRNDGNIDYASLIVDGGKKYESRKTDSLRPYVGKTVGIVRTGNGPAVAIGQVTIGEPIVVDAEKFNRLRKQHLVPQGSKFDIDSDGKKYLYPMIDPVRWDNEKTIKHRGIVSRKIQEQGVAEGESNDTAISLSKLGKFHPGADALAEFVPERASAQYALHPDKWESTFYSLTNKDSDKLRYYGPKKISIPPGTLVGDMAIANKFYRAKTPEEKQQYAKAYKASLQPYPVDVSQYRMPELLIPKQGVAEGLDDNGISFQVQKGKNKFATTLSMGNNPVGVYQYNATTGRSIAEVYPEFKGKGLGKLLVLHAIYTATQLGLDFQEDESRTSEYDNVLDSLSSNGYIVDDDGYWYVTGEGEQYLKQSLKQDMTENFADGKNPGRKGLAKRSGVNTKASVSSLRKTAKHSSGEKQRMAHWLANMKAGRAKNK